MKQRVFKRMIAACAAVCLIGSFCACRKEAEFHLEDFEDHRDTTAITYAFSENDTSPTVVYEQAALSAFQETLTARQTVYPYPELFHYEKAMSGMHSEYAVAEHAHSVLDANGDWGLEHFVGVVQANSTAYLAEQDSTILKEVDEELMRRICEIITEVITEVLERYPDIDRDRVYCNLGNLKIVEKGSALDFAAVEPGMVLHVNPSTSGMADLFTSSNMHSVIVHETMHILQYGCECETIDGLIRRCGLAYAYDRPQEQDYSDWTWLAEGSAERMVSLYANVEPMTYKTLVNYVLTLDLAVILRDDIPANYVETLNFYNDVQRLFDAFGAVTEEEKQEIYHMIYALEIIQMTPSDLKEAYTRLYGEEFTTEVQDRVSIEVKRPAVETLTKRFYYNLAEAVKTQDVTQQDVLFLLNLYDSTINYHLGLDDEKYDDANTEFVAWYSGVQQEFFAAFENLSVEDYPAYQAHDEAAVTVHAGMKWLDEEERTFLLEKFEDHFCNYKFIGKAS